MLGGFLLYPCEKLYSIIEPINVDVILSERLRRKKILGKEAKNIVKMLIITFFSVSLQSLSRAYIALAGVKHLILTI